MSFARAIATVGGLTMLSRLVGFLRDVLQATFLGAGPVADAFVVALKLPNLFRRSFGEGAFGVAFVPLFVGKLETEGRAAARDFADQALATLLTALIPLTALILVFMPAAIAVLAPGLADDPERFSVAVDLARIAFPYMPMICVVALMGGMLNSINRFAPFAATPVLFNIVACAALLAWAWSTSEGARALVPTAGHALSWGLLVAGLAQMAWMAVAAHRAGIGLRLRRPRLTPAVRRLYRNMGPALIGGGLTQLNLFLGVLIASFLPTGAISALYYADRINQVPLGVVGVAMGTALMPILSRHVKAGDHDAARHFQCRGIEFTMFLALPAAAALIVIPWSIVKVLFERGAFGADATLATAAALGVYAVGIPAYVLNKVFSTAFFAREDTKTPVKFAAVALASDLAIAVALILVLMRALPGFEHLGVAAGGALSAWLNVGMLALALRRRGLLTVDARLKRAAPRIVVATLAMAAALVAAQWALAPWIAGEGELESFAALATLVALGLIVYAAAAALTGAARLKDLRGLMRRGAPEGGAAA